MGTPQRMRQLHRWLSVAFMLGFAINLGFTLLGPAEPILWIGLLALLPLLVLMATGCYLCVLPYLRPGREAPAGSERG